MLKDHFARLTKDFGHNVDTSQGEKSVQDTVSEHMQMLYSKYTSASSPLRDGNTVRSFKAHPGMCLLRAWWGLLMTCFRVFIYLRDVACIPETNRDESV